MKPGYAFGDHIKTEKPRPRRNYYGEEERSFKFRGYLLPGVLGLALFVLLIKLFALQFFQGSYYRKLADSNRIRTQIIHAPRGVIFDRNGKPVVFNIPGFREVIGSTSAHLPKDQALSRLAKGDQHIEVDSLREYPYKDALAHVLGYIGQITKDELGEPEFQDYQATDWVGKSGIEKSYEHTLRGTDGKELIEVDALGRKVRSLGKTDPIPGEDIRLTIDAGLQQKTYEAAKGIQKGAVIVSTPDGQVLALVSKPSFDPNLFTLDPSYKSASDSAYRSIATILTDGQSQPLLDRAIGGLYPPGSTFKIVNAAVGLETHTIDQNYHIVDPGILKIGEFSFANWFYTQYNRTEPGELDVTRALARSNDIFFYKLAALEGIDTLSAGAEKFGLGQKLGIDLAGEQAGLVPTKEWKKKMLHEDWYLGDTYHYGIGQGFLLTTPLQVNVWTQVVANGGSLYQPNLLQSQQSRIKNRGLLSDAAISLVRQGMIEACSPGGVAWPLFDFAVQNPKLAVDGKNVLSVASSSADTKHVVVACKTGTAQHGGEDTLPHAWITLFAPAYNPQIVVTVLSESSGEGSNIAAPVAKEILQAYFHGE